MSSPEASAGRSTRLSTADRERLLDVAEASIRSGLRTGRPADVDPVGLSEVLRAPGAAFVTLRRGEELRGCIGSPEPYLPLAEDVARHAFLAAFRDGRFRPLRDEELPGLTISVSVLGPLEPVPGHDPEQDGEEELVARIRPGVDGLVLEHAAGRGVLLPSVWRDLPDPRRFLQMLKRKAGLPAQGWRPGIEVLRFTTESFARRVA